MRLGKTALVHFASNVVVSATGFAATFAIAYMLGPAGLGEFAIATALGFFWLAIPAAAIGTAIRKRVSEGEEPAAFLAAGLAMNVGLGIGLAAVIYLAGWAIPAVIDPASNEFVQVLTKHKVAIALLVLGTYGYRAVNAGLQGQKRVGTSGVLKAAERIGRTLAQVSVLLAGFGVTSLILGHAATLALAGVVGFLLIGLSPVRPVRRHVESLTGYAQYAWMGALRSQTFGWMDTIVLSMFVGASLIGIYEAAWGIASLLAAISGSIQQTLFPEFSELSTDAAYDRVRHYLDEGLVFAGLFVIPGLFGAAAIGDRVLSFYSPEFSQGAEILVLLVLAYWFEVYGSQFISVINAIDHPEVAYRINAWFVVSNLSLNVVLIWTMGWYGAAIATVVSSLFRLGLSYRGLRDLIGRPSVPFREIGEEILAAALMAAVVVWARPLAFDTRIGTLQLVGLGAVLYVLVLLAISGRIREKILSLLPAVAS